MLLHGIFPPITTPFDADGNVYHAKLAANVARYSRSPVAGIVVQGSTGEAILLSDQERRDVLKCAREAAAPEKVLIAGVGIESAAETLRLAEYAATLGYDVAMVRTPHFYKAQINRPQNMLAFYRFVCDRSPLPVIIYNFPQATAYDIPAEVVIELSAHPNLIGIKESSGAIAKVKQMVDGTRHVRRSAPVTEQLQALTPRLAKSSPTLQSRDLEVGFQVMVGAAQTLASSIEVGAVGAIVAFACAAPAAMHEIYAACQAGDRPLVEQKQQAIAAAATRIVGQLSVPAVKYACDLNGYFGGTVRLPLLPLTPAEKAEVEQLMSTIKG